MIDFLKWLITSSADPKRISLAVRGFLMGLVPVLMMLSGVTETDASTMVELIENLVFYGFSIVAVVQAGYGLIRKVWRGRWSHPEY